MNQKTQKSAQNTQTKTHRLQAQIEVRATYSKSSGAENKSALLGHGIDASKLVAKAVLDGKLGALVLSESKATGSLTGIVPVLGNGITCSVRITLVKTAFGGAREVIAKACGLDPAKVGCDATTAVGEACKAGLFSDLKARESQKGNVTASTSFRAPVTLREVEAKAKAETDAEKQAFILSQLS